jgi:hypothetical protein
MINFSPKVKKFLTNVGADKDYDVQIVPRSDSCAVPGDFVFFRYSLGSGKGSRDARIVMVVYPITKEAKTGNLLLTGFRVPDVGDYNPDSLQTLYTNKALPKENYRTYILQKVYGPIRRIRRNNFRKQ